MLWMAIAPRLIQQRVRHQYRLDRGTCYSSSPPQIQAYVPRIPPSRAARNLSPCLVHLTKRGESSEASGKVLSGEWAGLRVQDSLSATLPQHDRGRKRDTTRKFRLASKINDSE